jgi:PiT family inorganic phosphate transporter
LGAGAYVGWNIGANDTANCVGTTVGCGLISFRNAVIVVSIFAILGAMLQGQHVMKTIGKGIVKTDLNYLAVCVALICSGFFVTLATFFRIPTSTSQAIVGGVVGIGLAVGAEVDFSKFIVIAESWVRPLAGWLFSPHFMWLIPWGPTTPAMPSVRLPI